MLATLFGIIITVNQPQHQLPDGIYALTMYNTLGYACTQDVYVGCIGIKPCKYCMMDQDTGVMFNFDMYINKFAMWHQFEYDHMLFEGDIIGHGYAEGIYGSRYHQGYFTMEFKHER